jgi:putative endonuclease
MSLDTLRTGLLEGLLHALDRLPGEHDHAQAEHLKTGRDGELAALFYLRRRGYTIVARDWKTPRAPGDIDLIAWDGDTLCFVEVKTRTSRAVATAASAVDRDKRQTLRRLAGQYLRHMPVDTPTRFDVLSIYYAGQDGKQQRIAPEIECFHGAFGWSEFQA